MRITITGALVPFALLLLSTAGAATVQLLDQLRIDQTALAAAERDFRQRRERGTLDAAQASDYAAYLARLHKRVFEGCLALANSGRPLPQDLDCPDFPATVSGSASIDQATERTRSERTADLDGRLNTELGKFDEMLLREQERVKAATPRGRPDAAGTGTGTGSGSGSGTEAGTGFDQAGAATGRDATAAEGQQAGVNRDADQTADGDRQATGVGAGQEPSGARGGRAGTGQQTVARGAPPDVPDASGDDVVARQLREAAEKETDPALKKKLWEEYKKYRQGTR